MCGERVAAHLQYYKAGWVQKESDALCVPPEDSGPGPMWGCGVAEEQAFPGTGLCITYQLAGHKALFKMSPHRDFVVSTHKQGGCSSFLVILTKSDLLLSAFMRRLLLYG